MKPTDRNTDLKLRAIRAAKSRGAAKHGLHNLPKKRNFWTPAPITLPPGFAKPEERS